MNGALLVALVGPGHTGMPRFGPTGAEEPIVSQHLHHVLQLW